MSRNSLLQRCGLKLALVIGLGLVQGSLWADGVTRSVEIGSAGCKVTLAWMFTGKIESDLVIEERFSSGWLVDGSTVPIKSLDATWLPGSVARFAVKPTLAKSGSISFMVTPADASVTGTIAGDWKMYLNGALQQGAIVGSSVLGAVQRGKQTEFDLTSSEAVSCVEVPVAISSFRVLGDGDSELTYSGVAKVGTLVVEGCENLGKPWREIRRVENVQPGGGTVVLGATEAKGLHFMRIKLITEE